MGRIKACEARGSGKECGGNKRKVARRACLACREKKIKCDGEANPGPRGQPGKCTNCVNAGIECVFVPSNRGGRRVKQTQGASLGASGEDGKQPGPCPAAESCQPFAAGNSLQHYAGVKDGDSPHSGSSGSQPFAEQPLYQPAYSQYPAMPSVFPVTRNGNLGMVAPLLTRTQMKSQQSQQSPPQLPHVYGSGDYAQSSLLGSKYGGFQQQGLVMGQPFSMKTQVYQKPAVGAHSTCGSNTQFQRIPSLHLSPPQSQVRSEVVSPVPPLSEQSSSPDVKLEPAHVTVYGNKPAGVQLPSTDVVLQLVDLFYEYIHPNFTVLANRSEQLRIIFSLQNVSLTYTIFLCALPYQSALESPLNHDLTPEKCAKIISDNWDGLDFLESLQALNLKVNHVISFKRDKQLASTLLHKLVQTVAKSNLVFPYRKTSDFKELLSLIPQKSIMRIRIVLMNLWTAFSQLSYARNAFMDFSLLYDTLNAPCTNGERLEERIIPVNLLVPVCQCKDASTNASTDNSLTPINNVLRLVRLDELNMGSDSGTNPGSLYKFYLYNIFHEWRNDKLNFSTALNKLHTSNLSIRDKLYRLEDNNRLMVVDVDILNCFSLSEYLDLSIQSCILEHEFLCFDIFNPDLVLMDVSRVREAFSDRISSFGQVSIMQAFRNLVKLIDIVALIEIPLGNLPSWSTSIQHVPFVVLQNGQQCYINPNANNVHQNTEDEDPETRWKAAYEKLKRDESSAETRNIRTWLRYSPIFTQLLRFVIPKLLNYLVMFKFSEMTTIGENCVLVFENRAISIDETEACRKRLISRARESLYFRDPTLTDEEVYQTLLSIIGLNVLKQKIDSCVTFGKAVSVSMESGEQFRNNLDFLAKLSNNIMKLPL